MDALYVAVALTFSSTIIVVKLLSDKRRLDSCTGASRWVSSSYRTSPWCWR